MAFETRPRRRRDSLGPNPFRLGPRAQREVAKEEPAAHSPSSLSAPPPPTAPQAVPAPVLQAPAAAIEPPPTQEDRDPSQRSLSYSNSEAALGVHVAGPHLHALPPQSPGSPAVVAPQATPAPLYHASTQQSRPRRAKKNHGPSLLKPCSSIDDEKATQSPTWFLPYPNPSSVPTAVLEGLLRPDYLVQCPVLNTFPLHPRLKRELQLEQDRRSQVWLSSPLGRLPAEIRVMIYENVLIAPPSQSPITIRELSEGNEVGWCKAFAEPSSRKVPPVAILQTCRLIYREAQDIYYARNAFHTTSAKQLRDFLLGIGLARCELLTTLHIEGLLTEEPTYPKELLDEERREGLLIDTVYDIFSTSMSWKLDSTGQAASRLLKECKCLRKVHLLIGTIDDADTLFEHAEFARALAGEKFYNKVDFVDGSHWVVRPASIKDYWLSDLIDAVFDDKRRTVLFPPLGEGKQRCVEVDIRMDLKVDEM